METDESPSKKRKKSISEHERISLFYFQLLPNSDRNYKCKLCPNIERTQKPGSGYSNLYSHVQSHHPNYRTETKPNDSGQTTLNFMLPSKFKNIYSWLEWVIGEGLTFNIVEKELTRKFSNLDPICIKTLMQYMNKVTIQVENTLKNLLPSKFCLLFDGWTLDGQSTQFIGIYATFISNGVVMRPLLAFQPLLDESDYSSQSHKDLIVTILESFGKSLANVVCLIGDNCNTNIATAKLCRVPLIGLIIIYLFCLFFHIICIIIYILLFVVTRFIISYFNWY